MACAGQLVNVKFRWHAVVMTPLPSGEDGAARRYHHGDLRRALLEAAAAEIIRSGVAELSLRALARAAGVSHAAPAHHFGDKRGLLTALAAEGHRRLAQEMRDALAASGGSFLEAGVAYVRFAVSHPAHFEVMFRPDLHHRDDPELRAAGRESFGLLRGAAPGGGRAESAPSAGPPPEALAAWSLVHGLATLHLTGNLPTPPDPGALEELTRAAAGQLFGRATR